jgi:hypothetical protein
MLQVTTNNNGTNGTDSSGTDAADSSTWFVVLAEQGNAQLATWYDASSNVVLVTAAFYQDGLLRQTTRTELPPPQSQDDATAADAPPQPVVTTTCYDYDSQGRLTAVETQTAIYSATYNTAGFPQHLEITPKQASPFVPASLRYQWNNTGLLSGIYGHAFGVASGVTGSPETPVDIRFTYTAPPNWTTRQAVSYAPVPASSLLVPGIGSTVTRQF